MSTRPDKIVSVAEDDDEEESLFLLFLLLYPARLLLAFFRPLFLLLFTLRLSRVGDDCGCCDDSSGTSSISL